MSEPFLTEIRIFSFNFPPKGWAFCNGQFLPINQNQAMFALLGTTYGGNGQTNFQLPNLQGRLAMHAGGSHKLGEAAGEVTHTLNMQEMTQHTHFVMASTNQADPNTGNNPVGNVEAASQGQVVYGPASNLTNMAAGAVNQVGGSQPHNNMMQYLVLNFCIALQGIFPSQN